MPYIVTEWRMDMEPPEPQFNISPHAPMQFIEPSRSSTRFAVMDIEGGSIREFEFQGTARMTDRSPRSDETQAIKKMFDQYGPTQKSPEKIPSEPRDQMSPADRQVLIAALDYYIHEMNERRQYESASAAADALSRLEPVLAE